MMKPQRIILDKQTTQAVKGIAILMMIFHHCFGFASYWLDTPALSGAIVHVAGCFKLCVAVFAFLSGFGFFVVGKRPYRNTLWKTGTFLSQYWFQLFFIFLPIAMTNYTFSPIKIFYNLFAINDNIILFAWYVFFYLIVLLTFPLYRNLLCGTFLRDLLVVVIGGYACVVVLYFSPREGNKLLSALMDCVTFYPAVGIGYITAKHDLFGKAEARIHNTISTSILILAAVLLLRSKISTVKGFIFDMFYAPLFVFAAVLLLRQIRWPWFSEMLRTFGRLSFHTWLFHSIFFSAYTAPVVQPLVNWSASMTVRFLLVTALSFGVAAIIDQLYTFLGRTFQKFKTEAANV
ncbi:MAG: acyltransferase family protein [Clostridia bacterium]|nr:acyltransferase family protein [Clostridia bacterium]